MPHDFRVLSCNVRFSAARDGLNAWPHRRDALCAHLVRRDPDLLGAQEAMADQYEDLQRALPDHHAVGVGREDGRKQGEFAAIFARRARFDLLDGGTFWLSETPDVVASVGWDAMLTRICTWARLRDRAADREMLFANTHFDHAGANARTRSAMLLRTELPRLAAGRSIVLTGDFNSDDGTDAYRVLTADFLDSYRVVNRERSPDEASFNSFDDRLPGVRIDWILHTPDLVATAAAIDRTRGPGGRFLSDHWIVDATLRYARR